MKQEIKIPSVGESIREVTIGRILKQDGSFVEESEEIVELETEKVNQVIFAETSGVISWSVKEGDTATIDQVIGFIDTEGKKETKKEEAVPKKEVTPKKVEKAPERAVEAPEKVSEPRKGKKETRKPMPRIRRVIAKRLVESLHNSAMLTTFNEVDMSGIMNYRAANKESFQKKYGIKLGMTSFFVQAVVVGLKNYPLLNAYIEGDEIVQREYYDIGVAVSTEKGLVVPVIRDCDQLSFPDIEKQLSEFAIKARDGNLSIDEMEGGGFTISNGGVFGSMLSTPILNPPQVGILGLHKIENRPVAINDKVEIRPMMYLALSYDHRLIDGRDAILFLVKVKEEIENFKKG